MVANGGIANVVLRSLVDALNLCAACKNRILETDAPATDGNSATDTSRSLEKKDMAVAERASSARGSPAAAQTTVEESKIENDDTSAPEETGISRDTEPDTMTISTSSRYDLDIKFQMSTITKAQFTTSRLQSIVVNKCTWTNVAFSGCRLVNVTFTDCNLSNVVFNNVVLKNAHFYNVDFAKVRITDIELEDVEWTDQFLEQAVLGNDCWENRFHHREKDVRFALRPSTRTKGGDKAKDGPKLFTDRQELPQQVSEKISLVDAPRAALVIVDIWNLISRS